MRGPGRREVGPRRAGRARADADGSCRRRSSLHDPPRARTSSRSNGIVVDGVGVRRLDGDDGRGRAAQAPVAGIAMGLIMDEKTGKYAVLCGHRRRRGSLRRHGLQGRRHRADGITALQMDIKVTGITADDHAQALSSRHAPAGCTSSARWPKRSAASRRTCRRIAPRIVTIKIPVDKIRDVIGPGGKMIRSIIERTGVKIDVEDDGRVNVASADEAVGAEGHLASSRSSPPRPELNKTYMGKVQRITDFGAFVEIMPGTDGLLHVSEIAQPPRQGRARRAEGRRAGAGQGDQHRPDRQDPPQPQGAAHRRGCP